jgi:hypothetical protein
VSGKNQIAPLPVKCLLFLLISVLVLVGVRLFPATVGEGWMPALTLVGALGLLIRALIEIARKQ